MLREVLGQALWITTKFVIAFVIFLVVVALIFAGAYFFHYEEVGKKIREYKQEHNCDKFKSYGICDDGYVFFKNNGDIYFSIDKNEIVNIDSQDSFHQEDSFFSGKRTIFEKVIVLFLKNGEKKRLYFDNTNSHQLALQSIQKKWL